MPAWSLEDPCEPPREPPSDCLTDSSLLELPVEERGGPDSAMIPAGLALVLAAGNLGKILCSSPGLSWGGADKRLTSLPMALSLSRPILFG
ncbi:unnamed protein product [Gadus morhua 'NCC']